MNTRRQIALFAAAAVAPVSLGVAMHIEHMQSHGSTVVVERVVAVPIAIGVVQPMPEAVEVAPEVEPAPTPEPARAFAYGDAFSFVLAIDGELHVVLANESEEAWVGGAIEPLGDGRVRRSVAASALPATLSAMQDRSFTVYGDAGEVCSGELGAPFIYADAEGDLYDWESFTAEEAERYADSEPPEDPAVIWDAGRKLLVAPLAGAGDCAGARFARASGLPAPAFASPVARPSKANVQAARREYLGRPDLRHLVDAFDELHREEAAQAVADGRAVTTKLPRYRDRLSSTAYAFDGDVELVFLRVDGPEFGSCGGLAVAWAAAEVEDDGATVKRWIDGFEADAQVVLDIEGDGRLEVLLTSAWESTLATFGDVGMTSLASLPQTPYLGCPC